VVWSGLQKKKLYCTVLYLFRHVTNAVTTCLLPLPGTAKHRTKQAAMCRRLPDATRLRPGCSTSCSAAPVGLACCPARWPSSDKTPSALPPCSAAACPAAETESKWSEPPCRRSWLARRRSSPSGPSCTARRSAPTRARP